MERKGKFINAKDDTDRLKTISELSQVYQHTLRGDNYFQAEDLVLMSRLQKTIHQYDSSTQILYNRTMAHLGVSAFYNANIKEAHDCLADLLNIGKLRERLAPDLLLGQDTIEEQRQTPFQMHINLELVECVYLVSAMLIEIPYIAAHAFGTRRHISKTFYQQMRSSERQSFVGPPDKMREHVAAAAKAMHNGQWAACNKYIINDKMNKKVWNLFSNADAVRAMVTHLIKEETLRVYLFTFSYIYDSISISMLSEMFELEIAIVHCIIYKMIIDEGFMASLDEPSQSVIVHRKPSHLQSLALQLTDKINNLLDFNERVLSTVQRTENLKAFRGKR